MVKEGMQSRENYFVLPNQPIHDIPRDVEHLYFIHYENDVEENLVVLDFSSFGFTQLRSIAIGNECFQNVREFVLDGLEQLESVKIGWNCFRISEKRREDGICRIVNCPNLHYLEIGYSSFGDFNRFELSNVNSLQSITFGESCFLYTDCILKGE